jgi:hypothetical protein
VKGTVRIHHEWVVRFDYGTATPWVRRRHEDHDPVITAVAGPDKLVLRGPRLPTPTAISLPSSTVAITPQRDVHKVENPGEIPSVSIHIYGCDMGTQRRRRYDAVTGAIEWYTTPHDSDEVVVQ